MLRRHKAAVVIQSRQRGRSARRRYRSDLAAVVRLQMGLRRWQVCIVYSP
jgi:IQ calmodulin-binding motif